MFLFSPSLRLPMRRIARARAVAQKFRALGKYTLRFLWGAAVQHAFGSLALFRLIRNRLNHISSGIHPLRGSAFLFDGNVRLYRSYLFPPRQMDLFGKNPLPLYPNDF